MRPFSVIVALCCHVPALSAACAAPRSIPLHLVEEAVGDAFARLYSVGVTVNDIPAEFLLNCGGASRISESFAAQCHLKTDPEPALAKLLDARGNAAYLGYADARVRLGGRVHALSLLVMRDEDCQANEKLGVVGYDALKNDAWQIDPREPSLTFYPLGDAPATPPIADLPLRRDHSSYLLRASVRNQPWELPLMLGASFMQVAPDLQKRWGLSSGRKVENESEVLTGPVRAVRLGGDDTITFAADVHETDVTIALVGDAAHPERTPLAQSGIGQTFLNRFVYRVNGNHLLLLARVRQRELNPPSTQPVVSVPYLHDQLHSATQPAAR